MTQCKEEFDIVYHESQATLVISTRTERELDYGGENRK